MAHPFCCAFVRKIVRRGRETPEIIELTVRAPYRLDLTVAVLRRLSTNRVDRYIDGTYARAFAALAGATIATVRQRDASTLILGLDGPPGDEARTIALVRRMLGIDEPPSSFASRARTIPWLRALATRMKGVRAPRYPTLWEAAVNAVVFQQISIHAAAAMLGRTIEAIGETRVFADAPLLAFPEPLAFLDASDATLRGCGLSVAKVGTLRRVANELLEGRLDEAMLEERTSEEAVALLCAIKGIGPWTATVMLLRGLGRLDVFPMNDSGVARAVREFADDAAIENLQATLATLGDQRGMLYYHLLLARLEARDELAAAGDLSLR